MGFSTFETVLIQMPSGAVQAILCPLAWLVFMLTLGIDVSLMAKATSLLLSKTPEFA